MRTATLENTGLWTFVIFSKILIKTKIDYIYLSQFQDYSSHIVFSPIGLHDNMTKGHEPL